MSHKKTDAINVGGQAVIEGVMVKSHNNYVVAVRKGRKIVTKKGKIRKKNKALSLPFIRGFASLAEMLVIGTKSLMWSAEQAGNNNGKNNENDKEKIGKSELVLALSAAAGFVLLFFVALPYFLTSLIGLAEEKSPVLFNIIDGIIRIVFFLAYITAISFMKDVNALFHYHGAEHKAIHCYETGRKLSTENAMKFSTLHPRCGTSFLLVVFVISIAVFSLLPSLILAYFPNFSSFNAWTRKGILFPVRIMLVPVIAGISYEILKVSDKRQNNLLFKLISMPGLLLQKITTKEPSKRQMEVAITSLKSLLKIEKRIVKCRKFSTSL